MDNSRTRAEQREPIDLAIDRPHAARVYDYLLGGKTNYPADRQAARHLIEAMPQAVRTAAANRAFMHRTARFLTDAGIDQFLDIGTGIPTSPNLHETVQEVFPAGRVVYADNDPIVLSHSRALHSGTAEGATAYLDADLRDPGSILDAPELGETFVPGRPVAVMLLTVLHWLGDSSGPHAIVRQLMDAMPSGSYLVISHITTDLDARSIGAAAEGLNASGQGRHDVTPRTRAQVEAFFDGLDLVDPGLVLVHEWRPGPGDVELRSVDSPTPHDVHPVYVGVARKP